MYKVGDKIVYPMHGAGVIEGIEEQKFLKEKKKYYVMRMPIGDMKVMIPCDNTCEIGIRNIIEADDAGRVLEKFIEFQCDDDCNWNKRYRENMMKIRSGNILDVTFVVKTLMMREHKKGLSTGERKMLTNAKQILLSELVLAKNLLHGEIERRLEDIVEQQCDVESCKAQK